MSGKTGESQTDTTRPTGRPTLYSTEIGLEICERVEDGELLIEICSEDGMPAARTIRRWARENEDFRPIYAGARVGRVRTWVERIVYLSRDAINHAHGSPGTGEAGAKIQAIKLEIDTLKWLIAKELASEYGDLIRQEISGPDGQPIASSMEITSDIENRIKEIAQISSTIQPPSGYEPKAEA